MEAYMVWYLSYVMYVKNFISSPEFQERQPWVRWLTQRLSIIHPHVWTGSRFFGSIATIALVSRPVLSLIVFLLFALTDWVDGKVARIRNEQGGTGALLDGIADKVFIIPIIAFWGIRFSHIAPIAILATIEFGGYPLIWSLYKKGYIKKERKGVYEHIMAGKYKFSLQVALVSALWLAQNLGDGGLPWIIGINIILGVVISLAVLSVAGKINPKWAI